MQVRRGSTLAPALPAQWAVALQRVLMTGEQVQAHGLEARVELETRFLSEDEALDRLSRRQPRRLPAPGDA